MDQYLLNSEIIDYSNSEIQVKSIKSIKKEI